MAKGTLTVSSVAELKLATNLGFHPLWSPVQATVHCAAQFRTCNENPRWIFSEHLPCVDVMVVTEGVVAEVVVFVVTVDGQRVPVIAQGAWELTAVKPS